MSQCVVPNWNLRHQRQEQVEGEEGKRSSHVHNPCSLVPMPNYEVAELTWENGHLAMHGLGGLLPTASTKPTWGRPGDTLESIVHQATCHKQNPDSIQHDHHQPKNISSIAGSSGGKWAESSAQVPTVAPELTRKRMRSDSNQCGRNFKNRVREEHADRTSACASASATFCRDNDTTMMTWASFESPRSVRTKTADDDSACDLGGRSENRNDHEDPETKCETGRSHSTRRIRAAAIHNQSERRRRDRINQKMKALQKLVPNASKTDKASMLDEVIEYLKQLQAQVQMMSSIRNNMPQMMGMMPMQQHHHLQMSLLARMGMGVGLGMGMGMLDLSTLSRSSPHSLSSLLHPAAAAAPAFVPPPFVMAPPMINPAAQPPSSDHGTNASVPLHDPYYAFLAQQSMNIDLYNKMAALYQKQVNHTTQTRSSPLQSNHVQGD